MLFKRRSVLLRNDKKLGKKVAARVARMHKGGDWGRGGTEMDEGKNETVRILGKLGVASRLGLVPAPFVGDSTM